MSLMLGRLDPWFDGNINSLGAMMSRLPETVTESHVQTGTWSVVKPKIH